MVKKNINAMKEGKNIAKKLYILAVVPLFLVLVSGYFYHEGTKYISTDDAYIKMGISSISPQINGIVKEIKVKNTQRVKKGDVLVIIDNIPYALIVEEAEAKVKSAINQIENIKSSYYAQKANLNKAKADLDYYKKQYDRIVDLKNKKVASQADFDAAKKMLDDSIQNINNIDELMHQQLANLDGDADLPIEKHALYIAAKADLDKANYNLSNTIIISPFDGTIANLYIKEGSFATLGVPLVSVIDENDIWIEADFKETELTHIQPKQKALIYIDSFPNLEFEAEVIGITRATDSEFSILPAQNSSGNWVKVTQRVVVRLKLIDEGSVPQLSSGMSAYVTIDIKSV